METCNDPLTAKKMIDGNYNGRKLMRVDKACLVVALVTGVAAAAYAQTDGGVVKLPSEIEFKGPLSGAPQTAVL